MAIAFDSMLMILIVAMALSGCASSRVKRFRSFLAWAMTFPFLINVIAVRSSRNLISVSWSWPKEIRFESYSGAKATFCKLILLLFVNGIDIIPISSVRMTYPIAVIKSMLLVLRLLNSF